MRLVEYLSGYKNRHSIPPLFGGARNQNLKVLNQFYKYSILGIFTKDLC